MSYSWEDLTSKSDIFYNVLPLTNKKGELEDNLAFRITAKPKNSRYTFSANHTNGKRGRIEFSDKISLESLHDTELGFRINNKPSVKLFATLTDKLIPLDGSELSLELESEGKKESANANFSYADKTINFGVGLSFPLQYKYFNLNVANDDNDDSEKPTPQINVDFLFRPFSGPLVVRDLYVGAQCSFKSASEDTKRKYDIKGVLATKNAVFEGGLYVRKAQDSEEKRQVGAWATSTDGETTISSHFSYDLGKNQFSYENFAGFKGKNDDRVFLGVQVVPKLSGSFGYERALNSKTKISFGYAFILANRVATEKGSAFRFGLELTH